MSAAAGAGGRKEGWKYPSSGSRDPREKLSRSHCTVITWGLVELGQTNNLKYGFHGGLGCEV